MTPRSTAAVRLAVLLLVGVIGAPSLSAQCPELRLRTWLPGGQETWSESAAGVKVRTGEEAHVYLHVAGRGDQPYSTSATIGYPQEFGAPGRHQDVLRHVRMEAQKPDDARQGRIRFTAQEPGTTRLGYQVDGVTPPGRLDGLPAGCRRGFFPVEVLPRSAPPPPGPPPAPVPDHGEAAARELVERLNVAILRRGEPGPVHPGFVATVRTGGEDGVAEVARTMTGSEEFRFHALERTEQAHGGRAPLAELREDLLADIYRDLYGYVEPDARDADEDLADLDECLSGARGSREACASLGENLVRSRLFYERHRDLIERLDRRPRRR